ncbi:hypothetical protein [Agromyces marinus]|uniref:hypothetical protein n=1 Tax=Agromyces marinus TaxID=1389020 RepID=UPI001F34468B|nr:hypothetical protein [Agromyces marinus]
MEPLRLRKSDVAELGPGPPGDFGSRTGQERIDAATQFGERIGHAHEPGIAHLLGLDLRTAGKRAERRHRRAPRIAQRVELSLEGRQRLVHASILHPPTDTRIGPDIRPDLRFSCGKIGSPPTCGGRVLSLRQNPPPVGMPPRSRPPAWAVTLDPMRRWVGGRGLAAGRADAVAWGHSVDGGRT